MQLKLIAAAAMLAFATTAQASSQMPEGCPPTSAIISAGLNAQNTILENDKWAVFTHLQDAGTAWTFAVVNISAMNKKDAYEKAAASLKSLSLLFGPYEIPMSSEWGCMYSTAEGYEAIAMTGTHHQLSYKFN